MGLCLLPTLLLALPCGTPYKALGHDVSCGVCLQATASCERLATQCRQLEERSIGLATEAESLSDMLRQLQHAYAELQSQHDTLLEQVRLGCQVTGDRWPGELGEVAR